MRGDLAGHDGGGRGARRFVGGHWRVEGDGASIHAPYCAAVWGWARDEAGAGWVVAVVTLVVRLW